MFLLITVQFLNKDLVSASTSAFYVLRKIFEHTNAKCNFKLNYRFNKTSTGEHTSYEGHQKLPHFRRQQKKLCLNPKLTELKMPCLICLVKYKEYLVISVRQLIIDSLN